MKHLMRPDAFSGKSRVKRVYTRQMFHLSRVRSAFSFYMGKQKDFFKDQYLNEHVDLIVSFLVFNDID